MAAAPVLWLNQKVETGQGRPLWRLEDWLTARLRDMEGIWDMGFVMLVSIKFFCILPFLCLSGLMSHCLTFPFVSVNQVSLFELV